MLKEIGIGVALGVIIGLIWLGYNIYPVLFMLGIFFFYLRHLM